MKSLPILILCLLLPLVGPFATDDDATGRTLTSGDFTYFVLKDGTAEIREYHGTDESLDIPATLGGRAVTAIGQSAFFLCDSLTVVTIPDGVTAIGNGAFSLCYRLAAIDIPDSVTSIGNEAFVYCTHLTTVVIPDGVTAIGRNPFAECVRLRHIVVSPDHPTLAVDDGVLFSRPDRRLVCYPRASRRESYAIPDGTESIDALAFYRCDSLTAVAIPDSVTAIGASAFYECANLASITLPDDLETIDNNAFAGCDSLAAVAIPDGVTAIGTGAFAGCDMLTLIVGRDTYAREYCAENGLSCTYPDSNDWLNQ